VDIDTRHIIESTISDFVDLGHCKICHLYLVCKYRNYLVSLVPYMMLCVTMSKHFSVIDAMELFSQDFVEQELI